ncbi:MAG: hypothetical protein WDM86_01895 [Rhizomicrobium sp.]
MAVRKTRKAKSPKTTARPRAAKKLAKQAGKKNLAPKTAAKRERAKPARKQTPAIAKTRTATTARDTVAKGFDVVTHAGRSVVAGAVLSGRSSLPRPGKEQQKERRTRSAAVGFVLAGQPVFPRPGQETDDQDAE